MYRVMRTVIYVDGNYDAPYVIWEGNDPSLYKEGIGAFDEGDYQPSRYFEKYSESKGWQKIDDPRKGKL